ncbi:hypothetical protein KXW98_000277 [Aspergillus fumigatus]|uniref:NmrA-like domain-containing protein n=1 Tax=Aspergillus fumigatus TaxID=746128 RepID=A0A229W7I6_ASPFM|nr:hypothetical protein CNMCM8812_002567 [Aspergillus fumigatus]KMK58192.1 NmrA-like family protein [Aspergillus fumigatus Z5]KAF4267306.1 hypothetical protein CNMCM8714_003688 [Aspergillus fumigatus]KAF4271719.1 hypothetical protein CNMCM8057_006892 [Aspergillus fumigatus]KAF4279256.1 hypothetical protein CNMCM8689_003387 [Aspergillus fumigatus]
MTLKYLITGATGGLGKEVLAYFEANRPSSEYAAASSRESNRKQFEERGIAFRHVDYDDPRTLDAAFPGVENLFFVSTNVFDNEKRIKQHRNFVEAAKRAGVKHVWYTSLAFGGLKSDSKAAIQQAHLQTEDLLRESGLTFTSIREGVYADAFPLFINWYPDTTTVSLPADGRCAFTLRKELGEANARLMLQGGHENEIVLLTAGETISFAETVDVINETTGRNVRFQIVSPEEYVRLSAANDQGGKPAEFFQALVSWYDSVAQGEISHTHPLMKEVLGREPTTPREAIRGFLLENRDYTWHQNYVNK